MGDTSRFCLITAMHVQLNSGLGIGQGGIPKCRPTIGTYSRLEMVSGASVLPHLTAYVNATLRASSYLFIY